ncbi:hypothetical protein BDW72DRAFT_196638 [Aspergillus terricola var. indicus]
MPTKEIMCASVCDNVTFSARFGAMTSTVGLGVSIIAAYHGVQALKLIAAHLENIGQEIKVLTTLAAMEVVPRHKHDVISKGLNKRYNANKSHWLFAYHPDAFWTPAFCRIVAKHRLGPRFVGYTNQLDSLFLFLLATRKQIEKEERQARRQGKRLRLVKFHVLIPVHQLTVITEYLEFPEGLGDFVVEGRTYGNQKRAWLNVPHRQEQFLDGIGNWKPPLPSAWDEVLDWVGWEDYPRLGEPRILGSVPDDELEIDEDEASQASANTESNYSGDDLVSNSPPVCDNNSCRGKGKGDEDTGIQDSFEL